MRVGITLPQFRDDAGTAIAAARQADDLGLDGVFVFDHLWPLGRPDRPALHSLTLLGALAVETGRVTLGTLVARVGLVPDAVLVHAFATLRRMAGDRLVAGLGAGDRANRAENEAYGIPFAPKAERLAHLGACLDALRAEGITAWAGGLSPEVRALAAERADAWNGWGLDGATFASLVEGLGVAATWGGQVLVGRDADDATRRVARHGDRPGLVHGTVDDLVSHLRTLRSGGATWAVCAPLDVGGAPDAVALVAEAAARLRAQ